MSFNNVNAYYVKLRNTNIKEATKKKYIRKRNFIKM